MEAKPALNRVLPGDHPIVAELFTIICVVLVVKLWVLLGWRGPVGNAVIGLPLTEVLGVHGTAAFAASAFVSSGLLLASVGLIAAIYVTLRGLSVGRLFPAVADAWLLVPAITAPALLVAVTDLAGGLTGQSFSSVVLLRYGSEASIGFFVTTLGVKLFATVPLVVLVNQVVVQSSFRRTVGGDGAIVLTILLTAFVVGEGGLDTFGEFGRYVALVLFAVAVLVTLVAWSRFDRHWIRAIASFPAVLFVFLAGVEWLASIGSLSAGLYGIATVTTLAVAAYTYERSNALLVPALAYSSLLVASELVLFVLESGTGP